MKPGLARENLTATSNVTQSIFGYRERAQPYNVDGLLKLIRDPSNLDLPGLPEKERGMLGERLQRRGKVLPPP